MNSESRAITSTPVTQAVFGEVYGYTISATDPDQDPLEYRLNYSPKGMTIDQATGVISWTPGPELRRSPLPALVPVSLEASDGKGGVIHQAFRIAVDCQAGQSWVRNDAYVGSCLASPVGITITSQPGVVGVSTGDTYSYQVTASDANNLPWAYSLSGQPTGMGIDANSGLITWKTGGDVTPMAYTYQVQATDAQGGHASQLVTVEVCKAPQTWSSDMWMCM